MLLAFGTGCTQGKDPAYSSLWWQLHTSACCGGICKDSPLFHFFLEMQENCTVRSAHSQQALCCFSNVQSSSCMLDHRHENGLHLSEHQHLSETWRFWHCAVYCLIAFLSLSVKSAGTLILVIPSIYNFQSALLEKSHAVMVWKKEKKCMRKNSFSVQTPLVTSSLLSLPSYHLSKKKTQNSKGHKSYCSAEKLLIFVAWLTNFVLPTGAFKLKLMQNISFPYP